MVSKDLPEWFQMLEEVFNEWNAFSQDMYDSMNCENVLIQAKYAALRDKKNSEQSELPSRAAQLQRARGSSAFEILRRFHEAWENREDDGVIDALMVEMGEFLRPADGV